MMTIGAAVLGVHLVLAGFLYAQYRMGLTSAPEPGTPELVIDDPARQGGGTPAGEVEYRVAPVRPAPGAPPPATAGQPGETVYVVQKGDTYWDIAKAHGLSVNELMAYNGHGKNYVLKVNDKVRIPPAKR
jgi:LysM repeat protein